MLKRLNISNIALADEVQIELGPGLTVLTGETGAGKSILITALALAVGARSDREYVRHGASSGTVEAAFELNSGKTQLHARRTITSDGGSHQTIDDKKVTVAILRQTTSPLVEIVGQHANQALMDETNHIRFLDEFGLLTKNALHVADLFGQWRQKAAELKRLVQSRERLQKERELLLFQKKEIEQADISVGEEQILTAERKRLDSARMLLSAAANITEGLDGDDRSVLSMLALIRKEIETMAQADELLKNQQEEICDVYVRLQELCRWAESYGSSIEDNPLRIEEINTRLDELYKLKQKYGGSEQFVLDTLEQICTRLQKEVDVDSSIEQLTNETKNLKTDYVKNSLQLSKNRKKAAVKLKKQVENTLNELAIDDALFEIRFVYEDAEDGIKFDSRKVKPFEYGLESARFLFSANPGEPARSLTRAASGGEISRVLLAIKSAGLMSGKSRLPLMVFDEVDAGIGGHTAVDLANKLKELSSHTQVLVVTHLHQIARLADAHWALEKISDKSGRNRIVVRKLKNSDIQSELDRMIALPSQ